MDITKVSFSSHTFNSYSTLCSSHSFNSDVQPNTNASQSDLPPKGILMDSFTLGPTPKIDFARTLEHRMEPAWELVDLQFSLNTLSKHYGIHHQIPYKTQT